MEISGSILLYATAMFNCLFFGLILLLLRRGDLKANRWLAGFFIGLAIFFLDVVLEYSNFYLSHPHFAETLTPVGLLLGAFYFLYVQELTRSVSALKTFLHFIPALLLIFSLLPFYLSSTSEKITYLNQLYADQSTPYDWVVFGILLSFFSYLSAGLILLRKHRMRIQNIFSSDLNKRNLVWLQYLSATLLFVWLVWANFHVFEVTFLKSITPLLAMFIIFAIGYFAIQQNSIFSSPELTQTIVTLQTPENPVETKSETKNIQEHDHSHLADKLLTLMRTDRVYLNNELTLPKLAGILETSTNELSETINKKLNQNFYDFVNHYRVEESKRLLTDPKKNHLTVLGIGFDSGFNSKTTFNTIFKTKVGMTPSEFRKKNTAKWCEPIEANIEAV